MVSTGLARLLSRMAALAVAAMFSCSVWTDAANPTTNLKSLADSGKKPTPKTPIPVDRETEAKAIELVQLHLPELDRVLNRLRSDQPREYDRAVRDLAKSARKLDLAKSRDERLYEIEVELLKSQNEVNLLTAKLKVRDNPSDRTRLRSAAARLQQAQLDRTQYDVEMFRQRVDRAQQQLKAAQERLEAKRNQTDAQLETSYLGFLRKAGREPNE